FGVMMLKRAILGLIVVGMFWVPSSHAESSYSYLSLSGGYVCRADESSSVLGVGNAGSWRAANIAALRQRLKKTYATLRKQPRKGAKAAASIKNVSDQLQALDTNVSLCAAYRKAAPPAAGNGTVAPPSITPESPTTPPATQTESSGVETPGG